MVAIPFPKPSAPRVHAFFDGQNLFHAAKESFGYLFPNYDPIELATAVTTMVPGRKLEKVHFYTGIHDIRHNPFWHAFWSNKLALLPTKGVNVVTRKLKYSDVPVPLPKEQEGTLSINQLTDHARRDKRDRRDQPIAIGGGRWKITYGEFC